MDDTLIIALLIGLIFGPSGILIITWAIRKRIVNRRFVRTASVAEGVIVALETTDDKGGPKSAPVVEFVDHDDRKIRFTSKLYEQDCPYEEGDRVNVFYDHGVDRMELQDTIDFRGDAFLIMVGFILFGSIFLVITIGMIAMTVLY